MGFYKQIYLGPYLTVKGYRTIQVDCSVNTCSNTDCLTYKTNQPYSTKQNFCAECSHPIKIKFFKEDEKVFPSSVLDSFIDELVEVCNYGDQTYHEIFISNETSHFDRDSLNEQQDINGDDFFAIDFLKIKTQEAEIEWFKKRYKKILAQMEKEFGSESIEFHWGIIQWFN